MGCEDASFGASLKHGCPHPRPFSRVREKGARVGDSPRAIRPGSISAYTPSHLLLMKGLSGSAWQRRSAAVWSLSLVDLTPRPGASREREPFLR